MFESTFWGVTVQAKLPSKVIFPEGVCMSPMWSPSGSRMGAVGQLPTLSPPFSVTPVPHCSSSQFHPYHQGLSGKKSTRNIRAPAELCLCICWFPSSVTEILNRHIRCLMGLPIECKLLILWKELKRHGDAMLSWRTKLVAELLSDSGDVWHVFIRDIPKCCAAT